MALTDIFALVNMGTLQVPLLLATTLLAFLLLWSRLVLTSTEQTFQLDTGSHGGMEVSAVKRHRRTAHDKCAHNQYIAW